MQTMPDDNIYNYEADYFHSLLKCLTNFKVAYKWTHLLNISCGYLLQHSSWKVV